MPLCLSCRANQLEGDDIVSLQLLEDKMIFIYVLAFIITVSLILWLRGEQHERKVNGYRAWKIKYPYH